MNILFLVYHGFSDVSGISKKIHAQVKGLRENNHRVFLCYYDFAVNGHRCRFVDGEVLRDYGTGWFAGLRQRTEYDSVYRFCVENGVQMVYARCFQNASPPLVRLFARLRKAGIRAVTEVPTYPYDGEFRNFPLSVRLKLAVDRLFRRRLARQMAAMVTFSDALEIFGRRTIRISNGVDFDAIPLHQPPAATDGAIHLIGVAEVHYWHGYDRLVEGLGRYKADCPEGRPVVFHIVGGICRADYEGDGWRKGIGALIRQYGLEKNVVLHGQLFGHALDEVFSQCCFAVGSLARHRSGITVIKTLKNREYASRGIPFMYSECDSDFDNRPYVMRVPADESPIDVGSVVSFIGSHTFSPAEIRSSVAHLSWRNQMQKVVEAVTDMADDEAQ